MQLPSSSGDRGIGILGILAVVCIVLKLTGYIAWSWLWVLAPLWIPVVIGAVLLILFVIFASSSDDNIWR
jgi:uncharacterized membrane protein